MKYGQLTLDQMNANTHILGCVERVKCFLTRRTGSLEMTEFPLWKTVQIGLRQSIEEYRTAIAAKRQSSLLVDKITAKIPISKEVVELDLVLVDGYQLGFQRSVRRNIIYEAAFHKFGLKRCLAEVGLVLAEQYDDQPNGESVLVGMDPMILRKSFCVLSVRHIGHIASELQLVLRWSESDPRPGDRWAFVRPRK